MTKLNTGRYRTIMKYCSQTVLLSKGDKMGFGPAYKGGKLHHISCSQMSTFETCRYRWYADKVLKSLSLQDWSWAQLGVAYHQLLDEQVSAYLGKERKEDSRLLPSELLEEAQNELDWFDWERYFLDHEIIDSEMEVILDLNSLVNEEDLAANEADLPLLVGAVDVLSRDADGVLVVTDWKTGYGADKGVDIQAQAYTFMLARIFEEDFIRFRRIYPRLVGEKKGWKKIEEYTVSKKDTERYQKNILRLARQMKAVAKGDMKATTDAGNHCTYCSVAHSCPAANKSHITIAEMVKKLKILKAGAKQLEGALKEAALKDDLIVGDEIYGYETSTGFRLPHSIKAAELPKRIYDIDPELLVKNATVKINHDIKEVLEKELDVKITTSTRKSFKLKNEKELKEAAKAAKKEETTSANVA